MKLVKYMLFIEEDGATFTLESNVALYKRQGLLGKGAEPDWIVTANTWEEAMQKYYDYMDWDTYTPMDGASTDEPLIAHQKRLNEDKS